MWAPGASSYKKGAKKDYHGDLPAEETPAAGRRPARGRAVGHADDQGRPGPQDHRRLAQRPRRRARQRHRRRPPRPRRQHRRRRTRSTAPTPAGRTCRPRAGTPTTSDHGTHVAGTIAAARNGVGIVGVAPNVRMASVKVVNDAGFIYPEYAVCGFVWAGLKHMDVTNNSYYVDPFDVLLRGPARPVRRQGGRAARRRPGRTNQGVVHAAAAGNAAHRPVQQHDRRRRQPDDGTPVVADHQQRLRGHPDRARRRRDRVVDAALPGGHDGQPAVELLATAGSASSTSRLRARRSSRRSSPATATAPRAARRWPRRTSPACSP